MNKFFVLATKMVELRGIIFAKDLEEAKQKVKDNWYVYDELPNSVIAGTAEEGGQVPTLSEYPQNVRILHIQNETEIKKFHGKCKYCHKTHDLRVACPEYANKRS